MKNEQSEELYPHLFSSMHIGKRRLRNRIASASMFSLRAQNGAVTPELIDFYANRAAGGAAMIVTEPMSALRTSSLQFPIIRLYGMEDNRGLRQLADRVRRHDSIILAQLQDPGRGDMRPQRKLYGVAPSSLPDDLSWSMPHAMSVDEILEMQQDFTEGSERLCNAGFAGVELSCGHGHLHHQFMSPRMNIRTDEYGGSLENRVRFLVDQIRAIKAACGDDFLVGIRLVGNDGIADSIGPDEAAEIANAITSTCTLDYINFVFGSHAWTLHMHVPDLHTARGPYINAIAELRGSCNGVPVASTGRITEPVQAETLLAAGQADFVMLGRALLADPAWGMKSRQGRDNDIRKCVSSNNCWGESVRGRKLACDANPRVGLKDEVDWWPKRASRKRRIVVIGGGIAGLETAWVAAARGHAVTLFSQSDELGGKARRYASLPGCESASSIYDYQTSAAARAGVDIRTGHKATVKDVVALEAEVAVIASGGRMLWPTQLPVEWKEWGVILDLWALIDDLGRMGDQKGTAVIYDFDGSDVTYSAVEALSKHFTRTVIVTPVECIARDEPVVRRQSAYRRLADLNVEIIHWSEPTQDSDLESGRLAIRNIFSDRSSIIEDVMLFAYSSPRVQRDRLVAPLREAGIEIHVIGDAYIPRLPMDVMREAHDLGNRL